MRATFRSQPFACKVAKIRSTTRAAASLRQVASSYNAAALAGAAAAAAAAAATCVAAADCERKPLRRTETEGVRRRNLIMCRGGETELHANYDILGRLGRGGFGTVRKARHRVTGLLRALKTVTAGERENPGPDEWERMLAEVEALMQLNHPNIVRLYEYYRDETRLFLVEEYCSGGTLEQRLESAGGRFEADEAAVVLRQMLRGLLCCHAHGLVHRDLKPGGFSPSVSSAFRSFVVAPLPPRARPPPASSHPARAPLATALQCARCPTVYARR
jgi:hypothetical protein